MKRTFASIPELYDVLEDATFVVIPVPYDGTSSWGKGADQGPIALLEASDQVEFYDIELDCEPYKAGIHLTSPIIEDESPEKMVEAVHKALKHWFNRDKIPVIIGGEHSVSIGAIKAAVAHFDDVTIVQMDAHADLRPTYMGSECNHACAMHWASQNARLIQVGIRSMDVSEKNFMESDLTYFADEIVTRNKSDWMDDAIWRCTPKVYLTIDLDVFDPAYVPSTGTPEPGGLNWYQVTRFIKKLAQHKEIIGFDIVELCPKDSDKSSDFLAAKLLYKTIGYINEYKEYEDV